MKYLLDANAVIAGYLRARRASTIAETPISITYMSFISERSRALRATGNVALLNTMELEIVDFNREDARHAAEIRAVLASRGTPIGPFDVLIAGQARARQLTLITHNTAEFARVPYLHIEDWSRARGKRR